MRKIVLSVLMVLLMGFQLVAQNQRVSGTVTGPEGDPMVGVAVILKGTNVASVTNIDGQYSISVPANAILEFSYLGMETQEVTVSGRSVINVRFSAVTEVIDDVIVVAYGTARKSTFTGSASSVNSDDFKNTRAETADKMLIGKTSGIRVGSATGSPGSGGELQIRGIGSINGSTAPLYVVDGVPIYSENLSSIRGSFSTLTTLNPADIESMTILKDAAAASLYGSRAANGVVIITTKKGKDGRPRVNFSASVGISNMATNSYEYMSGTEYYDYFLETVTNGVNDGVFDLTRYASLGINTPEEYLQIGWGLERKDGEDWRKYFYGTGIDQNYQFTVSGGSPTAKYYLGFSYQDMEGILRSTGMKRYSFTVNTSMDVNKWLSFEGKAQLSFAQVQGTRDDYAKNVTTSSSQGVSTFNAATLMAQTDPTKFLKNPDGTINEMVGLPGNFLSPAYEMGEKYKFNNNDNARALINLNGEVRFTDNLKFRSVNGVDFMDIIQREYWGPTTGDGKSVGGLGQNDITRLFMITSANTLQYSNTFADYHNLDALAGYEVYIYDRDSTTASAKKYSTDKLPALSVGQPDNVAGSRNQRFMNSWFMNVNYNYDSKYYIGATVRTDKSSQLGYDHRRGIFWSVSGSWRLTSEDFLANNDILTDAKVRASYGTNGNLPNESYAHLSAYSFTGTYGSNSAIYPTQPENKELGWERSKNFNAGIEFTIARRFSFMAEYYNKNTDNLLLWVPSSGATGFPEVLQNSGEIYNRGFEFEFHGNNVLNTKDFQWNTDLYLTTLKSKVKSLPGGEAVNAGDVVGMYRYEEGQDLNGFYLPKWYGVDPQNGKGVFYKDPNKGVTYVDENGNTVNNLTNTYSEAQRGFVAKAYPDVSGSWGNTLSYKGFALNVLMTYQFGGSVYNYMNYFMESGGRRLTGGWNQNKSIIGNYWKEPGDVVDNPRPTTDATQWDLSSSRWVYSSDFIRLKEVSLSYSLPKTLLNRAKISDVTFTVSANNLAFVYAATKNMELESPLNGFKGPDVPISRTFTLGVSIGF